MISEGYKRCPFTEVVVSRADECRQSGLEPGYYVFDNDSGEKVDYPSSLYIDSFNWYCYSPQLHNHVCLRVHTPGVEKEDNKHIALVSRDGTVVLQMDNCGVKDVHRRGLVGLVYRGDERTSLNKSLDDTSLLDRSGLILASRHQMERIVMRRPLEQRSDRLGEEDGWYDLPKQTYREFVYRHR